MAKRSPLFFLHSLRVEGFRSIEDATFNFHPGLNVIIGANNSAKSAVIDALRLIFSLGSFERKEDFIKLRPTDAFMDGATKPQTCSIAFTATFYGKAGSEVEGQFLPMICPDESVEIGDPAKKYDRARVGAEIERLLLSHVPKGQREGARCYPTQASREG